MKRYFGRVHTKKPELIANQACSTPYHSWLIAVLLLIGLGIRVGMGSHYPGFITDQQLFVQWMGEVRQYGLGTVYMHDTGINYPPIFLGLMGGYAALLQEFGIQPAAGSLSYKSILIVMDLLAVVIVSIWSAGRVPPRTRMWMLALFALNPVFIVDGAVWGQVDILNGMLMAGSLLLLTASPIMAGVLFALALLTKLQAIVIAPICGFYLLRRWRQRDWRPLLTFLCSLVLPLLIAAAYFAGSGGLRAMIRGAYASAVGMYTTVTLNAFNIWYYLLGLSPDTSDTVKLWGILSLRNIGFLLLLLAVWYSGWYIWKLRMLNTASLLKAGTWIAFSFFMLPTEIHERYSVPALIIVILAGMLDQRWIPLALLLSVTITYNLWAVMISAVLPVPGIFTACIHVLALLYMGWLMWREVYPSRISWSDR